jgi:hypothetical protein
MGCPYRDAVSGASPAVRRRGIKGTAQAQRAYFNKCIANGGNMDGPRPPDKNAK